MQKIILKIFLWLIFIVFSNNLLAQRLSYLDSLLVNVDQSSVTSGIIYERVSTFANLYAYNYAESEHNTADYDFFKQALSEMHRASNEQKFVSVDELKTKIENDENDRSVVNIGILNTPFEILNYNEEEPEEGGLRIKDGLFEQIPGKAPFYSLYAFVAAPLKNYVSGEQVTFKFSEDLIFNNGDKTIETLTVDLGDGVSRNIIVGGQLVLSSVTIANSFANGVGKISFNVVFRDELSVITIGEIYFHNPNNVVCTDNDHLKEDIYSNPVTKRFVSSYPHQGYGESIARNGELQARVFYGNPQAKILKPLIIVDGFDPGDTRRIEDCDCDADPACASQKKYQDENGAFDPELHYSIVDLMRYEEIQGSTIATRNLIQVLREDQGFDVIIVNQPVYSYGAVKIDGGSDFIERNGKALVSLIEDINEKLETNHSTEQIVVVGPSMGGQISRYALAHMEKEGKDHNTRLWVSFDSPHHGANIPMGDQALVYLLSGESNTAKEQYENLLGSIAARQQLIEFHQAPQVNHPFFGTIELTNQVVASYLNGQVPAQVMPAYSGNPHHKEHYDNQYTNGLPGSKGFPVHLRKIALVNGSLTGKTVGDHNENVIDVRGFQRVCIKPWSWLGVGGGPSTCSTMKLIELKSHFMPQTGSTAEIAYFRKIFNSSITPQSPNPNNRGNMDIVPGGVYTTQSEVAGGITGVFPFETRGSFWQYPMDNLLYWFATQSGRYWWETRHVKQYHSFIPTFSAIAHKQPNQSWFNPLNRNLVCSDETYFDSYYGESENTSHVTLNHSMVDWLLKELNGEPQAPHFPMSENLLHGPQTICVNQTGKYYFADVCKVPGEVVQWIAPPNLSVISSTGNSVVVKAVSAGQPFATHFITAVFSNGQKYMKSVYIGEPSAPSAISGYETIHVYQGQTIFDTRNYSIAPVPRATYYEWQLPGNFVIVDQFTPNHILNNNWELLASTANSNSIEVKSDWSTDGYIRVRACNDCGCSAYRSLYVQHQGVNPGGYFDVSPNPGFDNVSISLVNENHYPAFNNGQTLVQVYNTQSILVKSFQISDRGGHFNVSDLPVGIYIMQIDLQNGSYQVINLKVSK